MNIRLNKRKLFITFLLALSFTVMQIAGYQISMIYGTSVHQADIFQKINVLTAGQAILVGLVELPVWCIILYVLFSLLENRKDSQHIFPGRNILIIWLISLSLLLICWTPCFLAGYPGFYNYDAFNQLPQALYEEVPYSAHHPLLHTLLMGKIIAFGYHHGVNLNDGIALHSIFQMFVCAACFSYFITYILKISGKRTLSIIAFCYYAFFPPIAMFSMSTTKDVLFSVLLQFTVIFVYEMCKDIPAFFTSKWKIFRLISVALLMCLFRKNGIYIMIALLPCIILLWKRYRRQLLLLLGTTICLYFIADKALLYALDAEKGSAEEALSVPIQQLARVYYEYGEDAFTADELSLIYEGISAEALQNYNPFLSDHVKNYFNFDVVQDNKWDYIALWLRQGGQHPYEYIRAFLDNTYQAWYPGTSICDIPYSQETYYFDMNMCPGGERDSKLPQLLNFYQKIASEYYYQRIPVIRLLFSIGAMFWVALFALSFAIYQKNKPLLTALLMILFCCATVLMGPISLVRYYLILFYGFPVSLGFLADQTNTAFRSHSSKGGISFHTSFISYSFTPYFSAPQPDSLS